jgi:hypothetical protein
MPAPCPIIILRHPCRDQRANRGRGAGADWSVVRHRACGHRSLAARTRARKNYLFAGSDAGGERAAAAHTLIETAKLNEVDPEAYLREVLGGIADHPINRIRELLP